MLLQLQYSHPILSWHNWAKRNLQNEVEADLERLKIRLMWDVYWKWAQDFGDGEGIQGVEEEGESEISCN